MRLFLFFFKCYGDHRDLHSFPTRRSSDLPVRPEAWEAMQPWLSAPAGNPASAHSAGRRARRALEDRSEEHTSELQSHSDLVCRLLLEKKKCWDSRDVFIRSLTSTIPVSTV